MKTITINRETIQISTPEHRALQILKDHGFAAPKSAFEEGPRKYRRYILPSCRRPYIDGAYQQSRGMLLGVQEIGRGNYYSSARVCKFFEQNKRHDYCVKGDARRINTILRKLAA